MSIAAILDSHMHYVDTGRGTPVVLLHGNPTSSYLWRNVIPHLSDGVRCLAPDLIGMGASGKPDIDYRFVDHARYLDAWFDGLGLDGVVLVGHDWGGALAMHWAARHADRVRGIALVETFLRPLRWSEMAPRAAELFRGFRSAEGERMVLEENMFLEVNLPAVAKRLTEADLDAYRAPYPTPRSRLPMLMWPREFPLDGAPADVVEIVADYGRWMSESPEVPKLLMALDNGIGLGSPENIAWAARRFASCEVVSVGEGGHHAPEDQPNRIGIALADWVRRHALGAPEPEAIR
ncbi:haloalkane dehalogenase [Nocardia arizonensis]|uniref:haloalkane dehalogenase n=1 Tax=Nocardia arizonensis TaxID=1141647 RepID=UPI0006CF6175|nr:haloalkane dehalogenase [Nocardia arizonensis]